MHNWARAICGLRIGLVLLLILHMHNAAGDTETEKGAEKHPRELLSLAESIQRSRRWLTDPEVDRIRRRYWRKTFDDIRNLGRISADNSRANADILSQWKLFLEDSSSQLTRRRRFEGFPSWDRMIQDWADEVEEYLKEVEGEPLSKVERINGVNGAAVASTGPNGVLLAQSNNTVLDLVPQPHDVKKNFKAPSPAQSGEEVLPHTNISDLSKRIEIVTTAALPWRTGTAVNPLLRAAYMTRGRKEAGGSVTISLPWLEQQTDQERVYGPSNTFATKEDQEMHIRDWLRNSANMVQESEDLNIRWYIARQNPAENSVYSMGDITALIPADEVDICILEEPEHLNWYRAPGESWTKKFKHVVGILHTNYFQYALDQPAALLRAPAMRLLCSWMCRAHCHRIIKLSGTIGNVAPEKELVENVHGVRGTFLDAGKELRKRVVDPADPIFSKDAKPTVYFIGKMLWSKGLGSLMELLKYAEESAGLTVNVDMFGGGPDKDAAEAKATSLNLTMPFHGPVDHGELAFSHKIFVNPSTSEVLCTTSAEALAMGKFVILPSHVSNDFFVQFPNCLPYSTKEEFVGNLFYAMTHAPEPLSGEYLHALTWEAATERLAAAGSIPMSEAKQMEEVGVENSGVQIDLPPLIESEEQRKLVSTTFRYTRHRFRQFRSRLSDEIMQNNVLPKSARMSIAAELEKKMDFDIDEVLESPKLRLQLSPAELDKSLLELYDQVSASPGGDVIRVLGGGGPVALQNLYMRRQAMKLWRTRPENSELFPFYLGDVDSEDGERSITEWVRQALKRNLPNSRDLELPSPIGRINGIKSKVAEETKKETTRLRAHLESSPPTRYAVPQAYGWANVAPKQALQHRSGLSVSLLI